MVLEVREGVLYRVVEVAQFLGITERTARRWCGEGVLPAFKLGRSKRWYVYGRDLLALNGARSAASAEASRGAEVTKG